MKETKLEDIISLAKRRGFIFQGSEIYGGLAGTWDYGPLGVELKNNIKQLWWRRFVQERDDMYGLDAAILMNPKTWEASGHTKTFADPLVKCKKCNTEFRADHIGYPPELSQILTGKKSGVENGIIFDVPACPNCGAKNWEHPEMFNLMFETKIGVGKDAPTSYLRPETAQGIFVNFKNVVDSIHPKYPFGIGQIGKAFRNEIAPRDFVFRSREFEQMEVEYFVRPDKWEEAFEDWRLVMHRWNEEIGLPSEKVYELEVASEDLAHYSKRTIDFEFEFPFGRKELYGLAYRTDFDLRAHADKSTVPLKYTDTDGEEPFTPHVIEPSLGVDRTVLAVLTSAYTEDEMNGETRAYLKLPMVLAPIKAAVFPLLKNKPELVAKAREIYITLKKEIPQIVWDDNGNIGKRYRRQDEIGTPYCITIDFDTLGENPENLDTVTLRHRDTGEQTRVKITDLVSIVRGN